MTAVQTQARNADLADLVTILQEQQEAKVDVVVPATAMRSRGGLIHIAGAEHQITDDGVTVVDGVYRPTDVFDEGVADKLDIPVGYLRRMRAERPDLYDTNVNGWLHGKRTLALGGAVTETAAADARSFFFRGFTGQPGYARALLSNGYGMIDHLDVLTAALDGVKEAGVEIVIPRCDLTDRNMYVQVVAPQVAALAPELLGGYRSPFTDEQLDTLRGGDPLASITTNYGRIDDPVVFAGFDIKNSETGNGAFTITPKMRVKLCNNGLTIQADAIRSVHLGGKMEDGIVRWTDDTRRKTLALVTARARDAVATFLDVEYVQATVAKLTAKAGARVADPAATIEHVSTKLGFAKEHRSGILDHFIRGGQVTSGGIMQAVTSYVQTVGDADTAAAMEGKAVQAMELAYAMAR